jgi:peptidyl-prolyl cis-trans isomerase C
VPAPLAALLVGWVLAFGPVAWLSSCAPAQDSSVLVVVNGRPITEGEFEFRWSELPESVRARYEHEGGKRKFLEDMIARELLLHEARRLGLDKEPDFRERTERYKEQLLLDHLMKTALSEPVQIADAELEAYYASHSGQAAEKTARDRLRQELYAEKHRQRFEDYLTNLRKSATIRIAEATKFVTEGASKPPRVPAR